MIRGVLGLLKWHHYIAAELRDYTVTQTGAAQTVTGTITMRDPFKMAQRPLVFVAPHNKGAWSWPILEHWIAKDHQFTARLGPMDAAGIPAIPPPQDLYV